MGGEDALVCAASRDEVMLEAASVGWNVTRSALAGAGRLSQLGTSLASCRDDLYLASCTSCQRRHPYRRGCQEGFRPEEPVFPVTRWFPLHIHTPISTWGLWENSDASDLLSHSAFQTGPYLVTACLFPLLPWQRQAGIELGSPDTSMLVPSLTWGPIDAFWPGY